ncbi:Cleft lip and palate transmembrane protein 1 -like protein [Sarcoptes scabiei]|uniref:Cleft lip and palate transmembrane protein 1 -like protein n=1 Tax=Sarcoptes scabiei TaxID=52283 RepID=A0A834R1A8_SARSC|nr:Cleft lip and palate transmembrane protein 1 -like protein [Sarcoptes scabiei]
MSDSPSDSGSALAQSVSPASEGNNGSIQQQPDGGHSRTWTIIKSLVFRALFAYFIISLFRRSPSKVPLNPNLSASMPGSNLYINGTSMDLYLFINENKFDADFSDSSQLVWCQKNLVYGDWSSGPTNNGEYFAEINFPLSNNVQNNGTLWLHVYVVLSGQSPNPSDKNYNAIYTIHRFKQLNKFKKRSYKKTHNLLTGETQATEVEQDKIKNNIKQEILSHWHPNLTINIIDDHTPWQPGHVPGPLKDYINFESTTGKYYPIVYLNDYWNLMRDYQPINDTVKNITLRFHYQPLSLLRWQMYAAQSMSNKWTSMMGADQNEQDDEEHDLLKETFLETSPILLGLTVVVSITHSIFEFLAFKNDIQFWKNRRSLEGLSVRSVFFNVFQSLIVLLYVYDNDTNFMIRVSVFIGLLIELWKIKKVVDFELIPNEKFLGLVPRFRIKDKGSYVESSTKEYDTLAFKYLSWVLFPLFVGYVIYSLIYNEHKGWYSFVLNKIYGFLLTFGFIMMTPQLFINYKLKSVAHLPWRMLTYKFLNTFIDDIFAFVIKMPTMYRLGCFRDDIIFLIYIYQRWIYKVDHSRVNEFGVSGDDLADADRKNMITNDRSEDSSLNQAENTAEEIKKNQ